MAPHDPLGAFKTEIVTLLQEALHSLRYEDAIDEVESRLAPAPAGKGDFAYPCFPLAKVARKAPPAIAKEVLDAMPASSSVEATVDGGYVNFRVPRRALVESTLSAVRAHGAAFGSLAPTGTTLILEHTSANPNGPFHVGRARNPILGDTLARVLRAAGFQLTTEYYVNDMGKQVAILAWGLDHVPESALPAAEREKIDHQKVRYYQKANELMEKDPNVASEINALLKKFETGDEEAAHEFREAASLVLAGMRQSLARLGVTMDSFFWESDLVRNGEVAKILEKLKSSEHAQEEDGAWFVDMAPFGVPGANTKWFFQRKDGTSLYTCRDVAYHVNKFARAERIVNVLGEDHKLTMQQLDVAFQLIGEERRTEVVFYAFVSLPEGKMSTRRNRVVFIDDLLDEAVARAQAEVEKRRSGDLAAEKMAEIAEQVGVGALRFNILSVQPEKSITFRWEDALNFEGDSAPFAQYAHARCASILAKAGGAPKHGVLASHHYDALSHASEEALVKAIARLPGLVGECADALKVHPLTVYVVELATAFNGFYRDCPVLNAEGHVREARLELVAATKMTLANALGLLGIAALETM